MHIQTISKCGATMMTLISGAMLLLVTGCAKDPESAAFVRAPAPKRLTIVTPHNAKIRETFANGFADWCQANRDTYVQIEWVVRGTPKCVEYIRQTFDGATDRIEGEMPDLMFGGGIADHMLLAERGQSQPIELKDALTGIPEVVNGLPTRDPEGRWFATGLSSFGIVYNRWVCEQRGILVPTTWEDLADPRFRGWTGIADPATSGSHRQSMVFILQSQGWTKGWSTLVRILGNSRALVMSSSDVLDQVGNGVFLAGFAVNFDGLASVDASGGRLAYINPPAATAATPDVTTVLKSADNVKLAEDFVRYALSESGQMAWGVKASHRDGDGATLYHYPIDPVVYVKYTGKLAVEENPFETDFGLRIDLATAGLQAALLVPLMRGAGGDNHVLLQQAWEAVIESGMKREALAELCTPPMDEEAAYEAARKYRQADADEASRIEADWADRFNAKYKQVIKLAKG